MEIGKVESMEISGKQQNKKSKNYSKNNEQVVMMQVKDPIK